MNAKLAIWREETRAKIAAGELDRFPNGRKKGGKDRTVEQIERAAADAEGDLAYRVSRSDAHQVRRARRLAVRKEITGADWQDARPVPRVAPADVPLGRQPDQVAADVDFDTAVDLAIAAIEEAAAAGLPLVKADVLDLESDFIDRLQAGGLPFRLAERVYDLLLSEEQRIDQGELEDLNRRARLEEAYEEFLASARSRTPSRPEKRLRLENQPPVRYPPYTPPVDNSGGNANRRAVDPYEFAQMVKAAGQARGRAYATPAQPVNRGYHSIAPWLAHRRP